MSGMPNYYPTGWDRERMLNAAASGELNNLSEAEMATFREGLRADLGEEGCEQFFQEMFRRETSTHDTQPPNVVGEPPFMQVMRLREERVGSASRWDHWGFVVFKSPEIRDQGQWLECRQKFDQMLRDYTDLYRGSHGLDECLSRMRFQWVEDVGEADAGVDAIARLYAAMNPLSGLKHSVCLYVTSASLRSILDSPFPSTSSRRHRVDIPFVVAVSAQAAAQQAKGKEAQGRDEEDIEGAHWSGCFKVAVETLLESLFPIVADDSLSPYEIGGHVSEGDIWCDSTRYGVHKAGIGYWDKRTGQSGT